MKRLIDFFRENDFNTNFRAIMGGLFVLFGLYIIFGNIIPPHLAGNFQYIVASIMIGHGVFRIVHIPYKKNIERKNREEESAE